MSNAPEATYTYAADSMVQQLSERNGTSITYAYNPLKEITTLKAAKSDGSVLSNLTYTYDAQGNQIRKNENGADFRFLYDSLNRIANNSQYNETYAYDARGNRQTLLRDQPVLPSGGTYAYDVWNRLTQVTTDAGITVTYRYNGDGLLYERAENGATTRYYYDGNQMIADATVTAGIPSLKARYVRGAGDRLIVREDARGNKAFYLHNGHGDVTQLQDSNGYILNSYTYDIWGNPLRTTETIENPFRYSSQYWDQTTGLQYLRARWYDPTQGRFLSEDTFEGKLTSPQSQNLYTYVTSNPLRYFDPTGHENQEVESFSSSGGYNSGEGTASASQIRINEEIAQAEINEAIEAEGTSLLDDELAQMYENVAVGKGSTGRTVPNSLNEQLAMKEVLSNPLEGAKELRSITMTDSRWMAQDGWVKMSKNVNGTEIHFVYNINTRLFDDFKFK